MISTLGGEIASNQMIRSVPIQLGSKVIKTDLVLLNLEGIDVILGANWMTEHRVLLDIFPELLRLTHHIKEILPSICLSKSIPILALMPSQTSR
jgi:hypothetical protein